MITLVAGARPNFVKLAPIIRELQQRSIPFRWIHTGQHQGAMSDPFLRELGLPTPDCQLSASGTHAQMTASVMTGVEYELLRNRPDWLVVVGDVNSTLGAAIAAVKMGIPIAHVEAGLRSNDWEMPEEVNRVMVDHISDLLLYPDEATWRRCKNPCTAMPVARTGARHVLVGNVMMDSLRWALARIVNEQIPPPPMIHPRGYAVLSCHRPSNVDTDVGFERVRQAVAQTSLEMFWLRHHRNRHLTLPNVQPIEPLGYLDMVSLLRGASLVITDSGGMFEEALYLGIPRISLRDPKKNERAHLKEVPEAWMTDAAPRIVDALMETT